MLRSSLQKNLKSACKKSRSQRSSALIILCLSVVLTLRGFDEGASLVNGNRSEFDCICDGSDLCIIILHCQILVKQYKALLEYYYSDHPFNLCHRIGVE